MSACQIKERYCLNFIYHVFYSIYYTDNVGMSSIPLNAPQHTPQHEEVSMIFAYTRISTTKDTQKHDRQLRAITDFARGSGIKVDRFFADTITGKTIAANRPQYQQLKAMLRPGDLLIVTDLDRIGRNAADTLSKLNILRAQGIKLVILDIPYMNDINFVGDDSLYAMIIDILITLKAHMSEQELEKTRQRIKQGLLASNKKPGRPRLETLPASFVREYARFKRGEYGKMKTSGLIQMLGMKKSTFYKYAAIYNQTENEQKPNQKPKQQPD